MTIVNSDLYIALLKAGVGHEQAKLAAAAVVNRQRSEKAEERRTLIWTIAVFGGVFLAGIAFGYFTAPFSIGCT